MDINGIAEKYGTPIYLYDKSKIVDQCTKLKKTVGNRAQIYYSMKANPLKGICQLMHGLGLGVEVASKGELLTALNAGVPSEKIIFTSPGKTFDELQTAITAKIKMINVDSLEEVSIIDFIAKEKGEKVDISIRINPAVSSSDAKIKMSGVPSQFGVEESEVCSFLEQCVRFSNINICGFQIYMGTQTLKPEDIENNTTYAIRLFLSLAEKYNITLKAINVGGGFGIKYFEKEDDLDMESLGNRLSSVLNEYKESLEGVDVIFESGRYLMAESGCFVTKVLYVKESKGTKYVICDGGSNCHSSAAFLGRFVRNNFPIRSIPDCGEKEPANITGPLCTPLDLIGQKVMINKNIKKDDYIVVDKSGAYGLTYSPFAFLSHDTPMEVIVDEEGRTSVLRERMSVEMFLQSEGDFL